MLKRNPGTHTLLKLLFSMAEVSSKVRKPLFLASNRRTRSIRLCGCRSEFQALSSGLCLQWTSSRCKRLLAMGSELIGWTIDSRRGRHVDRHKSHRNYGPLFWGSSCGIIGEQKNHNQLHILIKARPPRRHRLSRTLISTVENTITILAGIPLLNLLCLSMLHIILGHSQREYTLAPRFRQPPQYLARPTFHHEMHGYQTASSQETTWHLLSKTAISIESILPRLSQKAFRQPCLSMGQQTP